MYSKHDDTAEQQRSNPPVKGFNMGSALYKVIIRSSGDDYLRLSEHFYVRPSSLRYYYLDHSRGVVWSVMKPREEDLMEDGPYDGQSVEELSNVLKHVTPPLTGIDAAWEKEPVRAQPKQENIVENPRVALSEKSVPQVTEDKGPKEMVRHPDHYNFGKYEVIDVLFDWQLPYPLSDVVKYVTRAGKKDPEKELEDLEKARFYLNYRIKELGGEDWNSLERTEKPTVILNFDNGVANAEEVRESVQQLIRSDRIDRKAKP